MTQIQRLVFLILVLILLSTAQSQSDVPLVICPDNQSGHRRVPATSTGIIYSHSDIYTSNYGPDLNCTLIIYGFGNNATIDITVDTFATEKSDTLNIYGGNILQKSGNIEHNTVWEAIVSTSGELWFKFETTKGKDDKGFALHFEVTGCPSKTLEAMIDRTTGVKLQTQDSYPVSSIPALSCAKGYRESVNGSLYCDELGDWTGSPPNCELIVCPSITITGSLRIQAESSPLTPGEMVKLSCGNSLVVNGSEILTCLENGTWNGTAPSCQRPTTTNPTTTQTIGTSRIRPGTSDIPTVLTSTITNTDDSTPGMEGHSDRPVTGARTDADKLLPAVIGGSVGGVCVLIILPIIIFLVIRRKQRRKALPPSSQPGNTPQPQTIDDGLYSEIENENGGLRNPQMEREADLYHVLDRSQLYENHAALRRNLNAASDRYSDVLATNKTKQEVFLVENDLYSGGDS